jgi:osmotically-inducible protein OsmY
MSTAALTHADIRVRSAVVNQLDWDPQVDASGIGVAAKDGTVTLTGYVDTYAGKLAAERTAKRVQGVRAVANELEVRLVLERTDVDIARDAARALTLHGSIPEGVQVAVHRGHITLTGRVEWLFQKEAAAKAVRHVKGVRHVLNHIVVVPHEPARDVRRRIVRALHENADVDAKHISVTVSGDVATLTGTASTWLQRDAAERAAASAPGIAHVNNRILVDPVYDASAAVDEELC